jgi:glycosyltransferase involved in cell wall biosynthesis
MPEALLHIVNCLNIGGTERQLLELLSRLDRRRWRPLLAVLKPGGDLLPEIRALGIEPIVVDLGGSLTRPESLVSIARLALLCRREGIRVVHAHDFYSNVVGVAAARLARARAIASRRDLAHWLGRKQQAVLRMSLRFADCVVANAQAVGEHAVREEGVRPDKLRVVPNGIDVQHFDELARQRPRLPARRGKPRVAMVASMHLPDKGHEDLLEAAARLQASGVRAQWLLVSDGSRRPLYEERTRTLGLRDVHFLGRRSDVPAIWSNVDLAVHPSWAEGFPNAVLEAMCAGRAVVATRVGGTAEVLRDGEEGRLVEPHKPEALAERIGELITHEKRRIEMGRRGRRRVEQVYSLTRMTHRFDELWRALSDGVPPAAD